jgi:hypothetical protein
MTLPPNDRSRPKAAPEITGAEISSSVLHPVSSLDEIARHVDGTFVVVVAVAGGKYRRRCYISAKSAENAAGRAALRGEVATVYLAELKPLWKLRGGEAR